MAASEEVDQVDQRGRFPLYDWAQVVFQGRGVKVAREVRPFV